MTTPKLLSLTALFLLAFCAGACSGTTETDAVGLPGTGDDTDGFPVDPDDTGGQDQDGENLDGGGDGLGDGGPPLGGGSYAVGTITITIEHPDRDTVSYELACFGDTATMIPEGTDGVRADRACTALAMPDVEGRLVNGPPQDQMCTEIFGSSDIATVKGMLNGAMVDTSVNRVNGCGISDWDILLADVLPAALGES